MRTAAVYGKALYADLYRAFFSKRFAFSVLLVIAVLLAASFEGIALHTEVLYVFSLVMYGMPAMLVIIGGVSAYADSIFSDIEHRYIRGILSRTGIRQSRFWRNAALRTASGQIWRVSRPCPIILSRWKRRRWNV